MATGGGWGLVGGEDLRRVSLELRRMGTEGGELRKGMRRSLRKSAAPMVPAVRASIGSIPTHSPYHSGLRKRLQRATWLRIRSGGRNASVRVLVDPRKMPNKEKAIPQLMEGTAGRPWRHPVFGRSAEDGNRGQGHGRDWTWRKQDPHPYFFKTVRPLGIKSRVEMAKLVRETSRQVL